MQKKKSIQAKFRKKKFSYDQYWNLHYTERLPNGEEKDFKTFIKSRSFELSKDILIQKSQTDTPGVKIKALQGFMFHKAYKTQEGKSLRLKEWEQIRSAAFPNENNVLFKFEETRAEWKTNRFNKTNLDHIKSIGFKSGDDNWSKKHRKGKVLPLEDRNRKIYKGHWVDWDPALRSKTKARLITALESCKNNRWKAAIHLGVCRNAIYRLFLKFPEVNWREEYPPAKPSFGERSKEERSRTAKKSMERMVAKGHDPFWACRSAESQEKRTNSLKETCRKRREERLVGLLPKMRKALLACGNNRTHAAKMLNISDSCFRKAMKGLKDQVDWSNEYPLSSRKELK